MSEKPVKSKDVVSLNVETNLQTTVGRDFLNQINKVSRVLYLKDTAVEFKGEQLLKTGYFGMQLQLNSTGLSTLARSFCL